MTTAAMRLSRMPSRRVLAAEDVLPVSYRLEVVWVDAHLIPAKVVQLEPRWHGADERLVNRFVGQRPPARDAADDAVALAAARAEPLPAAVSGAPKASELVREGRHFFPSNAFLQVGDIGVPNKSFGCAST